MDFHRRRAIGRGTVPSTTRKTCSRATNVAAHSSLRMRSSQRRIVCTKVAVHLCPIEWLCNWENTICNCLDRTCKSFEHIGWSSTAVTPKAICSTTSRSFAWPRKQHSPLTFSRYVCGTSIDWHWTRSLAEMALSSAGVSTNTTKYPIFWVKRTCPWSPSLNASHRIAISSAYSSAITRIVPDSGTVSGCCSLKHCSANDWDISFQAPVYATETAVAECISKMMAFTVYGESSRWRCRAAPKQTSVIHKNMLYSPMRLDTWIGYVSIRNRKNVRFRWYIYNYELVIINYHHRVNIDWYLIKKKSDKWVQTVPSGLPNWLNELAGLADVN